MTRRKGETTAASVERKYPHRVAVAVPERGFAESASTFASEFGGEVLTKRSTT